MLPALCPALVDEAWLSAPLAPRAEDETRPVSAAEEKLLRAARMGPVSGQLFELAPRPVEVAHSEGSESPRYLDAGAAASSEAKEAAAAGADASGSGSGSGSGSDVDESTSLPTAESAEMDDEESEEKADSEEDQTFAAL